MKKKLLHLIIMGSKYTLFGFILTCILFQSLIAARSNAQEIKSVKEVRVNLAFDQVTLIEAFNKIEQATDFIFIFNDYEINKNMKISTSFHKGQLLSDVLLEISRQANLQFKQVNKNISVKKITGRNTNKVNEIEVIIQTRNISGRVTSYEDGEGLPGVNVIEKGTSNGTVTDVQGEYSLEVSEDAIIVFSSVGYTSEEIAVNGRSVIDVAMTPDIKQLQELVVVGYGTLKERDIVGSVSTVKAEDLQVKSTATFDAALQGMAAGVSVQSESGVPGAPTSIKIRGMNSINSSTEPLWIIDGMPVYSSPSGLAQNTNTTNQSPMSLINPNDIESIQVLKDAAATAIYGSRASNGVIIITTKSGKEGEGTVNFDYSTGVSDLSRKPSDIGYASTEEWFQIMDEKYENSGKQFTMNDYYRFSPYAFQRLTREEAMAINTNWYDELFQKGRFSDYNLSSSGGFEKGNYYLSANYREDIGVQKNNSLKRFSGRANIDFRPLENFTMGTKLTFSYSNNNRLQNTFYRGGQGTNGGLNSITTSALPWLPVYDPDNPSSYFNPYTGSNPVAYADPDNLKDELKQYRGLGTFFIDYDLPFVEGLSVRTEASFDLIQSNNIFWRSRDIFLDNANEPTSNAVEESVTWQSINYNLYGTFDRQFNDHYINVVAGVEGQRTNSYRRAMEGEGLVGNYQQIGTPSKLLSMWGGMTGERYLLAAFSRMNYKFKDRYLLGLSIRRDGTSAFTEDYRWGTFAALSAGWIISEEEFFSSLGENVFLKIRGSYGETGNQNVRSGLNVINYNGNLRYGSADILGLNGTMPANVPVSDLTWETTRSTDVGVDFGFFDNRINGSLGYYQKYVEGMLLQGPIPWSSGITPFGNFPGMVYNENANNIWSNIGDMSNSGVELEVSSVNIHKNNFKWSTKFNVSFNKNKIHKLTPEADKTGKGIVSGTRVSRTGHMRQEWFMAKWAGVDPENGLPMIYVLDKNYYDSTGVTRILQTENGADSLTFATASNLKANRFHLGNSADPTYYGGISNTFQYKGFDLSFLFSFSGGNYIYDYDEQVATSPSETSVFKKDVIENSWRKPGDQAKYPELRFDNTYVVDGEEIRVTNDWVNYDRTLYKGDFIRLKNVQIGYTFQSPMLDKLNLQRLRIYLTGSNLWTKTDYPGFDPEGASHVYTATIPQLKTFLLGINVGF